MHKILRKWKVWNQEFKAREHHINTQRDITEEADAWSKGQFLL